MATALGKNGALEGAAPHCDAYTWLLCARQNAAQTLVFGGDAGNGLATVWVMVLTAHETEIGVSVCFRCRDCTASCGISTRRRVAFNDCRMVGVVFADMCTPRRPTTKHGVGDHVHPVLIVEATQHRMSCDDVVREPKQARVVKGSVRREFPLCAGYCRGPHPSR